MAGSYNRITVVGNLTRDCEIRYVDGGGKAVTKFALAINRKSKSGDETMYIDIVAWERLGEICNEFLHKGMSVLIEGRLVIRDYTNKDVEKRKAIEIVANDMQMLDKKRDGESRSSGGGGGGSRSASGGGYDSGSQGDNFDESMEDEIPFNEDPREQRAALEALW